MSRAASLPAIAILAPILFAAPAVAQPTEPSPPPAARRDAAAQDGELRLTDVLGQPVYVAAAGAAEPGEDRESIGDISDVLMTPAGRVTKVLVGVGGFLGVGEKTVALPIEDLTITADADDPSAIVVVSEIQPDVLEAMEPFTRAAPAPKSSSAPGEVAPPAGARTE